MKKKSKDNLLIFETHSKVLLLKNVLVATRPSYQHLLMKLPRALLRRSTFRFLAESEFCWHFPVP